MTKQTLRKRAGSGFPVARPMDVHDLLSLALDVLGDRPQDVDRGRADDCLQHQCAALKITQHRLERVKS